MRVWSARLAAGLMLIGAKSAFAYRCETVTSDTVLQPKAIAVQRDLPVGSVIAEIVSEVTSTFKCSNTSPSLTYQEAGVKAFGTYDKDFDGKRVYKTNIEGIGYAVGSTPISQCNGVGTSPDSTRTKTFDIPLTCSKGASINLKLDGTAHDATKGMLKLDEGTSPAKGVAIQLLYDDKPVELAKSFKWQTADAEGTYAIPLKARYVQTDKSIAPGIANGSATFTLTYQ